MDTDTFFSLGDVLAIAKRRSRLLIALGLPIALFGAVLALALPEAYRSTATFELVRGTIKEGQMEQSNFADEYIYRLADRMKRSPQFEAIVGDVIPYPDLADQPGPALGRLRADVTVGMITEGLLDPWSGRVREVHKGFTISYENRSPELAHSVALRLAEIFPEVSRASDLERAAHDLRFYTDEVERTRAQIAEQEGRLAEFKEKNYNQLPEVAQLNLSQREGTQRDLTALESELRVLQRNRILTAQQLEQARSGPTLSNLQQLEAEYARKSALYASEHPDVIALRRQIESLRSSGPTTSGNSVQAELEAERAALSEARERYSDDHPDVRRMLRKIEALEVRVAAGESDASVSPQGETVVSVQLQTQLNALDSQISAAQARRDDLRSRLAQFESRLGSTPEVEREFQAITRDLGAARHQYEQMLNRRLDAEVVASAITSGATDRFRLLDPPAYPWGPAKPARKRIVLLFFILAGVVAVSSAVAAEILDSRVRGTRDIRTLLGVSPLAAVPMIRNSVYRRRRRLTAAAFVGSVLIGVPVTYMVIRLVAG